MWVQVEKIKVEKYSYSFKEQNYFDEKHRPASARGFVEKLAERVRDGREMRRWSIPLWERASYKMMPQRSIGAYSPTACAKIYA